MLIKMKRKVAPSLVESSKNVASFPKNRISWVVTQCVLELIVFNFLPVSHSASSIKRGERIDIDKM